MIPTTADDIREAPQYRRQAELLVEGEVPRIYALNHACAEAMRDYLRDEYDVDAYVNEKPERLTVELRTYKGADVRALVDAAKGTLDVLKELQAIDLPDWEAEYVDEQVAALRNALDKAGQSMNDPKQIARRHYDADAEALGDGERLTVDEPVGWLTGIVAPPSDPDQEKAVREEYQRLRDEHGGRPRHEADGVGA